MNNKYIAIEGVIGVGKTTLARLLQPRYDASTLLEVVEDNPFLSKFYQDRERFAFQTQIFFLLSRYHQQYQAIPAALRRGNLISDYTFAKDELFAWLNLKDDELVTKLVDAKQEAFNLRFRHATGELENTARLGQAKRDVARLLTVARARGIDVEKETRKA